RQKVPAGGRIAFGRGRLTGRQSNLALRHRKTRERIDHQQNVLTDGSKILGYRRCRHCSPYPQEWRLVRRGSNNYGTHATFRAKHVHKLAYFPPALTDQRQHGEIGGGAARHHADQRALADAAASEDSDALSPATRNKSIDRANAAANQLTDGN